MSQSSLEVATSKAVAASARKREKRGRNWTDATWDLMQERERLWAERHELREKRCVNLRVEKSSARSQFAVRSLQRVR